MFKKPLGDLKTSAPLRSSDRRKLRQRVVDSFNISPEAGDVLVPDGLLHNKFRTYLDEPGVLYLSPNGDPLWFTIGKTSEELIPTVHTLWKNPALLPVLTTPAPVIPKLIGGADLMAPGVVQFSSELKTDQLVAVSQYYRGQRGPPLAIGRMAIAGDALRNEDVKGKAVIILQTWKDHLWEVGKNKDVFPPDPVDVKLKLPTEEVLLQADSSHASSKTSTSADMEIGASMSPNLEEASEPVLDNEPMADDGGNENMPKVEFSPEEVTSVLRLALIQAIRTTLTKVAVGSFPMPASQFYSSHILPNRLSHQVAQSISPIDIKHSSYKSLAAFLKACEKEGLVALKTTKSDVLVANVNDKHEDVTSHRLYRTTGQEAEKAQKREAREKNDEEQRQTKAREVQVLELWKPHQTTLRFFEDAESMGILPPIMDDRPGLFSHHEVKTVLNAYVTAKDVTNKREQAYINVGADNVLATSLATPSIEFMKREELLKRLLDKMQAWYLISVEGHEAILKKGKLLPINVTVKIRQGRKACTLITAFEPYGLVAEDLASALQHACASSTAVAPLPGKNAGLEVMVQGKQLKQVADLLLAKGVSKSCIVLEDRTSQKK